MVSLGVFASAYGTFLLTGDDEEFAARGKPLPAAETPLLIETLRDALWHALWVEASPGDGVRGTARRSFDGNGDDDAYDACDASSRAASRDAATRALARALAQVHDRNGRLRFVDPSLFHAPELFGGGGGSSSSAADGFLREAAAELRAGGDASARRRRRRGRAAELLRRGPALVPFEARVRWFSAGLARDRAESAGRSGAAEALGFVPEHHVTVTRGRVFADALEQLGPAVFASDLARWRLRNPTQRPPGSLKGTIRVRFLNRHGVEEPGVDGGGLFKDFLSALAEEAFDKSNGLFVETPDRTLYPNPASERACGRDHLRRLEFLGAVLGKAVYEGVLVDVPLAGFFLAKLRDGRPPELNDLSTLDPELYHHLLGLKNVAPEHVESLGLDFTATDRSRYETPGEDAGAVVELVPGGSDIPVTAGNRKRYVHLMAHHLLHRQIKNQSRAFVNGFRSLIPPEKLRVFAPAELRLLISGAGGGVDVSDIAKSAVYSGGYAADHPSVRMLWEVVSEMEEKDQRAFLKFVTACPNTPLLGFSQLAPSFCVHRAGMRGGSESDEADADTNRLPTAATCVNTLKLPPYVSKETFREKLLTAIRSESGFDLS
jgi:ubiquitin-protein ligase E3 C